MSYSLSPYETKMKDSQKTKKQLIEELQETRRRLAALAASEAEAKQSEAELRDSEEKFQKAFRSSPNMIIIIGIEDGKYIEVNDSFVNITGYSRKELIGHTVEEYNMLAKPEEQEEMVRLMTEKGKLRNEQYSFRTKSGEIIPCLCSVDVCNIGDKPCLVAVASDITELKRTEEALRESEEKYRTLVDNSIIGIMNVNITGKITYVNKTILEATGYSRNELVGKNGFRLGLIPGDTLTVLRKRMKEKLGGQPPGRLEMQFKRKDGKWIWLQIRGSLLRTHNIPVGFQLIGEDITEHKQAEEALRESEEKLSAAFRSSPQAIAITTVKEGRFIEANESHSRVTGYTRQELIGRTSDELNIWVNPEDRKRVLRILKEKGRIYNEELEFYTKSGEIQDSLFSAELINIGGEECIISSTLDITERKLMEEALRESEGKFSAAFYTSPEMMAISSISDGVFLEANDSFTRVTGYTRDEIIGCSAIDVNLWVKPDDRDKMVKQLKEKGRVSNEEYLLRTKRGNVRNMLFSAELVNLGEEPCVLSVSIDITDFRKMEEQAREAENLRKLDKLRTELLANISHELRTPLASIKGFATMLLDYEDRLKRRERREYLEIIDNNTDRMVELIEQLLEMSRLEAGMLSIKKKPASIIKLCREVIAEVRVRASSHRFTLDIPAKLPRINVDARRIRQILDNIIDNSVKYSDAGTEINLSVRREGNELLFTITDHGVGIPPNDLPRVFTRMFRSPQKHRVSGIGLGLSICKGLTEAHNGRIWIESEEGIGTKCFFTLPLDTAKVEHS